MCKTSQEYPFGEGRGERGGEGRGGEGRGEERRGGGEGRREVRGQWGIALQMCNAWFCSYTFYRAVGCVTHSGCTEL